MESRNVVLYGYWRSSCTWRLRNALNLKGVEYSIKVINLLKQEQLDPTYTQLNAIGQVPTLRVGDNILTQSIPIIEFIDENWRFRGARLLPDCPYGRANVRRISEIINSGIQPLQNLTTQKLLGKFISESSDKRINDIKQLKIWKMKWAKHVIEKGFEALEQELKKISGKYCFNDEISMADCCLVPQVYNAKRFGVDMKKFPIISRINDSCMELKAFKKAHPSKQPDAINDIKSKL